MSEPFTISTRRRWAALLHASALIGFAIPLGNILGPLVVWSLVHRRDTWLDAQGRSALNFQFSMLLYFVVGGVLLLIMVGLVIWVYVVAAEIWCSVAAAVLAAKDRSYAYPLAIRFIGPSRPAHPDSVEDV